MESCVQSHLDLEQGQIHFYISKLYVCVCALKYFFFLILQSESAFNGATLTMGLGKRETHEKTRDCRNDVSERLKSTWQRGRDERQRRGRNPRVRIRKEVCGLLRAKAGLLFRLLMG